MADLDTRRALGARAKAAGLPVTESMWMVRDDGTVRSAVLWSDGSASGVFICDADDPHGDGLDALDDDRDVPDVYAPGFLGHAIAELERRTGGYVWVQPHTLDTDGEAMSWGVHLRPRSKLGLPRQLSGGGDRAEALIRALETTPKEEADG